MTPERWQQIGRLFHEILDLEPTQRANFIATHCAGDEALRREVESLISSHEQAHSFVDTPSAIAAELLDNHASKFEPGHHIANYVILRQLGSGGMGDVYLAEDNRLNRKIALKFLPAEYLMDADRVRRFEQEARAASALNHPNILTVHDIGTSSSAHFIAAEFVDGVTLRQHLQNERMTLGKVIDVATQIAAALAAAHEAEIIHRDIKPENIMLRPDGFVKVLDFGLAKLAWPNTETKNTYDWSAKMRMQTDPGIVIGTVHYMSPEQARGENIDRRSDLWSLGVVLYEMLAGQLPFDGETRSHVIVSILENEPIPLLQRVEIPTELERIVGKALRKKRDERYQTATELARDLKTLADTLPIESRQRHLQKLDQPGRRPPNLGSSNPTLRSNKRDTGSSITRLTSTAEYVVNGIKSNRKLSAFAATSTVLLLVAFLYIFIVKKSEPAQPINSLAVVSFINAGSDPDARYLAEGLSNNLNDSLSRLPNLKTRLVRYTGKVDASTVGSELGVRAVLVGSLARRGDSMTINAELIDVRNNRRIWAAQYERRPSAILDVQKEITVEIAKKLGERVDGPEYPATQKRYTSNAEAYDAYARGNFLLEKRTGAATEKSIEYFQQAIKLDPNYALAYAALGYSYNSLPGLSAGDRRENLIRAKAAVTRALELDETLAEAHTVMGSLQSIELNWVGAEASFKRGTELNPNSGFAHTHYAFYLVAMRRFEEAVAEAKRAVELEPTSVLFNRNLAMDLYFARHYDEAIQQCDKTIELDPNMMTTFWWLAQAYEQKGSYDRALIAHLRHEELGGTDVASLKAAYAAAGWKGLWRKLLELKMARSPLSAYKLAELNIRLGDTDKVLFWLEKAHEQNEVTVRLFTADPQWDTIRSDARFIDLIERMGLKP